MSQSRTGQNILWTAPLLSIGSSCVGVVIRKSSSDKAKQMRPNLSKNRDRRLSFLSILYSPHHHLAMEALDRVTFLCYYGCIIYNEQSYICLRYLSTLIVAKELR